MIRPVNFGFNSQTAVNNSFQVASNEEGVHKLAEKEFDDFVSTLRGNGIDVFVINDTPSPYTPDSIFPNNWISFHEKGTIVFYPMFAANRRMERKPTIIDQLKDKYHISTTIDLSGFEEQGKYLEGTGSMVLDRDHKIAYACLSPRTNAELLSTFCNSLGYKPIAFTATDSKGMAIYHTNVMMCVADRYIVVCLESVKDEREKKLLIETINGSGKELIEISIDQMARFAGNMLQVHNNKGEKILVMSSQAYESLTPEQVNRLSSFNKILHSSLNTIESNGGGSARCMMAEVYAEARDGRRET